MVHDRFRRRLAGQEILFRQGEQGDCAYVVEAGTLEVTVERGERREVLSQVGPGALLGEMALLDNSTRMATVTALQPCTLRVLTRKHLAERLDLADPLLRHILQLVITRYREVVLRRGAPATANPPARLARDEDQAVALDRLQLEQDLELAVELEQLQLHFQPILRLEDGTVAGFEALLRWSHPVRGLLMPDAFIPLAEQSGLIIGIGHWVLRAAMAALAEFDRTGHGADPLFMTVNLSGRQFADAQLLPMIRSALSDHGIEPQRLLLEITESLLLDFLEPATRLTRDFEALGVRLSVDDFGTGYSALSYLYRLPVSSVKFARAFINDLDHYPASPKIIGAVARLAGELAMDTVCEGIESAEQAAAVRRLGVRYGQGFHFARGLPLSEALRFAAVSCRGDA